MPITIGRLYGDYQHAGSPWTETVRWLHTVGLLMTLALGLLYAPHAVEAQPPGGVRTIGVLGGGRQLSEDELRESPLWQAMRQLGWVEGQNIAVMRRHAEGHDERLPMLAAELVQLPVDVLLTDGTPAVLAAKHATSTIPIIMSSAADPVSLGIVESLARPSGNITGVSQLDPELAGKQLALLREALPGITRVAVLTSRTPIEVRILSALEAAAQQMGLRLQTVEAHSPDDVVDAFAAIVTGRAEALYVIGSSLTHSYPERITDFAVKNGLPVMSNRRLVTVKGGLMPYQHDHAEAAQRVAMFVDKILKGAKAGDLPVEQPMKFELVINLKTAKALGLTIPPSVLFQATEVIQ